MRARHSMRFLQMSLVFRKRGITVCFAYALLISVAVLVCQAQQGHVANVQHSRQARSVSESEDRKTASDRQRTLSQLAPEAAAQPASVTLKDGKLTIAANNSDLTQILKDLSDKSGMMVHGLSRSSRIFGVYGPGDSREVLRSLLAGSGYNFIIVGGARDGVPRELMLAPTTAAITKEPQKQAERDDFGAAEQERRDSEERGPGAVYPVAPPAPADEGIRIEQNLQRLQHLEERRNDPQ